MSVPFNFTIFTIWNALTKHWGMIQKVVAFSAVHSTHASRNIHTGLNIFVMLKERKCWAVQYIM